MLISFLWGSLAFREPLNNAAYAGVSIVLLMTGVYCVGTSQTKLSDDIDSSNAVTKSGEISGQEAMAHTVNSSSNSSSCTTQQVEYSPLPALSSLKDPQMSDDSLHEIEILHGSSNNYTDGIELLKNALSSSLTRKEKPVTDTDGDSGSHHDESSASRDNRSYSALSILSTSLGFGLCLMTGFFDGSLMVPFKLSSATNLVEIYNYLGSFGVSSLFVCPVIYILYVSTCRQGRWVSKAVIQRTFFPGVASGILWSCANFMSVHATYYLGIKIGFPLTQTCIIFTSLWGIFYFKELSVLTSIKNTAKFLGGTLAIVLGAYFLAVSGQK